MCPHRRTGVGLRGGGFVARGAYFSWGPLRLTFHADRFVSDVATSGHATWSRSASRVSALLHVTGPHGLSGTMRLTFPTDMNQGVATATGTIGGRAVDLTMPSPWAPLG